MGALEKREAYVIGEKFQVIKDGEEGNYEIMEKGGWVD